jgi:hypothetical protein
MILAFVLHLHQLAFAKMDEEKSGLQAPNSDLRTIATAISKRERDLTSNSGAKFGKP